MDVTMPPVMGYEAQQGILERIRAQAANMGVLPDGTPAEAVAAYREAIQKSSDAASATIQARADWGDPLFAPMLALTKTAFSGGGGHAMA